MNLNLMQATQTCLHAAEWPEEASRARRVQARDHVARTAAPDRVGVCQVGGVVSSYGREVEHVGTEDGPHVIADRLRVTDRGRNKDGWSGNGCVLGRWGLL